MIVGHTMEYIYIIYIHIFMLSLGIKYDYKDNGIDREYLRTVFSETFLECRSSIRRAQANTGKIYNI